MARLPSEGERSALVGFAGQFQLAARIVIAKLGTLEWIHVADPAAGIADDFQFKSGQRRHALQVKWSQLPGMFNWSDLTAGEKDEPGLWTKLAAAWIRLREVSAEPLTVYLCTNNHASTTAATGKTPLATSSADKPRSLAAFLARAFTPVRTMIVDRVQAWSDLAALPEVVQWEPAWTRLRQLSGLSDNDFVLFIRDLELMFGLQPTSPLLRPDEAPDDREVDHLAQTLQNIVADPSRKGRLSRDELLSKLDWVDRLRYRHPHRFPMPMVYVSNEAAREALESAASDLTGGYLALVGPAGSGKSTLLSMISFPGHIVHYYAFVPDSADPLSGRGEADSFFHDLSLALEDTGLRRSGVGTDLRSRQRVLLDLRDQAGVRWEEDGEATVIVIDGLDHIPREQRPTRSLLEELPAPAALPHGVFVVLGTQTVSVVPSAIQATLASEGRTVELPPLTKREVEQLAEAAGLTEWLYPGHIKKLAEASEGHPLALTYVLEELKALEEHEPDAGVRQELASRLLVDASNYGGDIE
ncbi:hypothetical protein C8D87_11578 [Lentzea atacamensis]|uniref:AAA+ ATPase domain-containing protein n=1 Tax=Lentzea atacamensis TaxID=531938 RepID=A0ABX9DVM3_9PSEU|nr:hypothetical protein C8D87_11578 [Lentzea atacamensis]